MFQEWLLLGHDIIPYMVCRLVLYLSLVLVLYLLTNTLKGRK